MALTPVDLFAFGSKSKGPRSPRMGIDFFPDEEGMVGPEVADGASTYADPTKSPLTGHYFRIPAGTELPHGLDVVADGQDLRPDSEHQPTHHTIFPVQRMKWERFVELFEKLPWQYVGKRT